MATFEDVVNKAKSAAETAGKKTSDFLEATRLKVDAASGGKESTVHKWETCRVVGVYRHLVVLVRPCGLRVSRTYVDLYKEMRPLWQETQ